MDYPKFSHKTKHLKRKYHQLDPNLDLKHLVHHASVEYVDNDVDGDVDDYDKKSKKIPDENPIADFEKVSKRLIKKQKGEIKHTKRGMAYEELQDTPDELVNFFNFVSKGKKEKKQEFEELVGKDYFEETVIETITPKKKKKLKKNSKKNLNEDITGPIEEIENKTIIEKSLGILAEPENLKNSDPVTPLDKKFMTLDEFNKHYNLFLSRIQQQLSTLGGGGEANLTYMDVPVRSVTSSSYSVKHQDYYIGVNYSGAVTITLPKADREGKIFVIKDESGEASKGTNRYITVFPTGSDLIDGRDRAILAYDYGSLTFIWKGNSWRVV